MQYVDVFVPTWGVFLDEEKQGGGPLIDIGTHALDLTLWMMDNYEPESVMGSTFHKLGRKKMLLMHGDHGIQNSLMLKILHLDL